MRFPCSRWFEKSVRAIVAAVLQQRGAGAAEGEAVSRFVLGQHGRMPDYLRLPLVLVTLAFDTYPCVVRGRPFHCLDLAERARFLQSWKHGRLGVQRDMIEFYESLAVFGWQAEQHVDGPST
jgi:hypothetical protein